MVPRAGSAPLPPDLAQCLCEKAHWGKCIFAKAPRPAVCQCVRAECSFGQGVESTGNATSLGTRTGLPVRVQNVANQLDRLGMESPFSGERSS